MPRPVKYSQVERDFIQANCALPRKELTALFVKTFDRSDIKVDHIKSLCTREGWKTGRDGRFAKGIKPWNTGKAIGSHPNSAKTQFKTGQVPRNAKEVGYERICKNYGYVLVLTDQTNPYTGAPRWFRAKHRVEWEKQNGPIPDGYILGNWDGDKTNTDPDNWFLLTRSERAILNRHHSYFHDLETREQKEAVLTVIKIQQLTAKRAKDSLRKPSATS